MLGETGDERGAHNHPKGEPCILSTHPAVRKAIDLIERQHEESLSVQQLADAVGVSRFHFSRLFRQAIGKSPYQYLLEVRLDSAHTYLRSGLYTVTEVATAVGFSDLSRFGRMFRRRFGCSPSRLRS